MRLWEIFDINEVFTGFTIKDLNDEDLNNMTTKLKTGCNFIKQIQPELKLYRNKDTFFILNNDEIVTGWLTVDDSAKYIDIKLIYTVPEFRKSGCTHWILYATKEHLQKPYMIDGMTTYSGQTMINRIFNHKTFNVNVLNKKTNEMVPYDGVALNDHDLCYIIESHEIPYKIGNDVWEEHHFYHNLYEDCSL